LHGSDELLRLSRFRERGSGDPPAHQDEDEDIRVHVFSLDEARAMVRRGDIVDPRRRGITLV
jgi:hypothetical protein